MNIAVLGYGLQGKSSLEYWQKKGHTMTICDRKEKLHTLPNGVQSQLGEQYLENLDRFDLVVRSPSIHPDDIVKANNSQILEKVTTNTNEFMEVCPSHNIIGVTGTKGKGTTSTLIANMLIAAGFKTHLGGNIGTPPLELLKDGIEPSDWVVLELANFQLIDIKLSPPLAVCLMIEPEHMDWHPHMEEYVTAKQQLFRWQTSEDVAVYFAKNELSKEVVSVSPGRKIGYFGPEGAQVIDGKIIIKDTEICDVNDIKLLGKHNWQNVCAAVTAVWQVTHDAKAIREAIKNTEGLPFRLEFVRELNGVKYYNDSFGTTPATAIVAIESFQEPKIVILGGSSKGSDYSKLAKTVAENNVRAAIVIGKTGSEIETALKRTGFNAITRGGDSMEEIVKQATDIAKTGDVVVLSTACASFDMFKNYKDRGEQFNQAVQSLA